MAPSIDELTGTRPGATIWVLGNGPSIWSFLPALVPMDDCIGVNRILRTHNPEFVLMVDLDVWRQERKRVYKIRPVLLCTENLVDVAEKDGKPAPRCDVFTFTHDKFAHPEIPYGELLWGPLTICYAAEIAARMVYPLGTVVLAGVDLKWPDDPDRPTHSFGDGREVGCRDEMFEWGVKSLCKLREALAGRIVFLVAGPSELLKHGFEKFNEDLWAPPAEE